MVVERPGHEYGQAMAEQAGRSVAAIGAGQTALSRRHSEAADADRALAQVIASAHAVTVEGIQRLDAIAAEIDRAVANQAAIGLDTAIGAREFQRFLIEKQREIVAVVSGARELDVAKRADLEKLAAHYSV